MSTNTTRRLCGTLGLIGLAALVGCAAPKPAPDIIPEPAPLTPALALSEAALRAMASAPDASPIERNLHRAFHELTD